MEAAQRKTKYFISSYSFLQIVLGFKILLNFVPRFCFCCSCSLFLSLCLKEIDQTSRLVSQLVSLGFLKKKSRLNFIWEQTPFQKRYINALNTTVMCLVRGRKPNGTLDRSHPVAQAFHNELPTCHSVCGGAQYQDRQLRLLENDQCRGMT